MNSTGISYWIQHADYSSDEFDAVQVEEAILAYQQHDWNAELAVWRKMTDEGEDCCPPGIGYVADDDRMLHLLPEDEKQGSFHYMFKVNAKLLFLIPYRRDKTHFAEHVARERFPSLIRSFFQNRHAELLIRGNPE